MTKRHPIPRVILPRYVQALICDMYPDIPSADIAALLAMPIGRVYQTANRHGVTKSAAFRASPLSGRARPGVPNFNGAAHQFHAGQTPWNKGLKGWSPPGVEAVRFQKGNRPQTWVPVGSYRINSDNTLEQKTTDVPGPNNLRWTPVARLVWIAAHGPVPAGHIVVFKPGQHTTVLADITLERVECIGRAEHAWRNHPASRSPDLAKLVQLKGAITRQVNRITRQHQEQQEQHAS